MDRDWRSEFWPLLPLTLVLMAPLVFLTILQGTPQITCDTSDRQRSCEKRLSACAEAIMGDASGTREDFVQQCLDRVYYPVCDKVCTPNFGAKDIVSKDPISSLLQRRN
jgi:hypothetical protein